MDIGKVKKKSKWAYSKVALRIHGMDEVGVRFPVGPQKSFLRISDTPAEFISKKEMNIFLQDSAPNDSGSRRGFRRLTDNNFPFQLLITNY